MQENPQKKKPRLPDSNYARYAGMTFQMGATIALGVWGGIKLDEYFALKKFPVFTLSLSFLAVIASMYFVIKGITKK